jgi:ribonuclease-3
VTEERAAALAALSGRLGHSFRDLGLLDRALTHTSWANEAGEGGAHNEAMEFLGDAVIGLVVAEMLHEEDPEGREGRKTAVKSRVVGARTQAERADALGIPGLLKLGRASEKYAIRENRALWADAYEAVVAALYLDGGLAAAQRFLRKEFAGKLRAPRPDEPGGDAKSALQELLQRRGQPPPAYVVLGEEQSAHATRFRVQCVVDGTAAGEGEGFSKKEAQQEAARRALAALAAREEKP